MSDKFDNFDLFFSMWIVTVMSLADITVLHYDYQLHVKYKHSHFKYYPHVICFSPQNHRTETEHDGTVGGGGGIGDHGYLHNTPADFKYVCWIRFKFILNKN